MSCLHHTCVTPTLAQVVSWVRHLHPHAIHDVRFVSELLLFSFDLSPALHSSFFRSFLSMYSDDFDSVTNNLRNSAKGTFVTSDDTFPLTGYEPNAMELNGTTELNDSQSPASSLTSRIPSSPLLRHQTTTWMTWHARQATRWSTPGIRRLPPSGRCKSQSVVNVCHGEASAQNQFPAITQTERMVDRTEKPVEEIHRNCWGVWKL